MAFLVVVGGLQFLYCVVAGNYVSGARFSLRVRYGAGVLRLLGKGLVAKEADEEIGGGWMSCADYRMCGTNITGGYDSHSMPSCPGFPLRWASSS